MDITLNYSSFSGVCSVPSSKSHSIRALLIATFAESVSRIHNLSDCGDVRSCISACRALGAEIYDEFDADSGKVTVVDSTKLKKNGHLHCDVGESGTGLFFLTALSSTLEAEVSFTGTQSLNKRSASYLISSLRKLGADISSDDYIPYTVKGPLQGGETNIKSVTSQFLSALLLACPLAKKNTAINISELNEKPYIQMTLYWLDKQGIRYKYSSDNNAYFVYGNQHYKGFSETIYGDFSAAGFLFAASAISGGKITVRGLNLKDKQGDSRILNILKRMGCEVIFSETEITLIGIKKLKALDIDMNSIPDCLPILSVVCCFADSEVRLYNIAHARFKESDRISAIANNLNKIGADVTEKEDGLIIRPIESFSGGVVCSFDDHRIAMAMAVASLRSRAPLTIKGAEVCDVSFPHFFELFASLSGGNAS